MSNEEEWIENFNKLKNYIEINNKKPSYSNNNDESLFLTNWIYNQASNYKNKNSIMKNDEIKKLWEDFINSNQNKKYFI
jgi:hypothetical protein